MLHVLPTEPSHSLFSFCNFLDDREVLPFMSNFPVGKQYATTSWSEFGHCMKHLLDN